MATPAKSAATGEDNHTEGGTGADHTSIALPRRRSPATLERIRTKNRRKRYLDLHPEYFSSSLELAGLQRALCSTIPTNRLILEKIPLPMIA